MVEDRVTDGKRVAQLLASELSGREDGALGALSVVDADRDADPSPDGTVAYGVAVEGERVGDVALYPERVEVVLWGLPAAAVREATRGPDLVAADPDGAFEAPGEADTVLRVESGAAVKRAVDALVAGV